MKKNFLTKLSLFAFSLFIAFNLWAEESKEPPQEMFDACKDKNAGDRCSYTNERYQTISGICTKDSRVILCYPDEPKKKEH
ncbi:MAG: hypothetical protein BGO43_00460 [Gammaproteobacteria bacterium 39-13]|nr:hypothetical protein [Gammaproteobacteria bacterium]OJV96730.1 MAG: hypothetical protein BGO43_00460 [Gammaproteobacteria bacterium 39-13]